MLVTIEWIKENYDKYNDLLWGGSLPPISFKISNARNTWGFASYRYNQLQNTVVPTSITLSNYYDSPEEVKLNTLVHEMIHIADYSFHPEHFIRNGIAVSRRSYDAHGPIFFLKEARRLRQYGFDVEKNVQQRELDASELSDNNMARVKDKVEAGCNIILVKINPAKDSGRFGYWGYRKISDDMIAEWEYRFKNKEWYTNMYTLAELYRSHHPYFADMRNSSKGNVYYCKMKGEEFKEKYGLKFVKTIYDRDGISSNVAKAAEPVKSVEKPAPKPIEQPVPKPAEKPMEPVRPTVADDGRIKRFELPLMGNGTSRMYVLDNVTIDELRKALMARFPKWTDERIESIVNNKAFRKMNESSMTLFETIVGEVMGDIDPMADAEVVGQRWKITKINDDEGFGHIE